MLSLPSWLSLCLKQKMSAYILTTYYAESNQAGQKPNYALSVHTTLAY